MNAAEKAAKKQAEKAMKALGDRAESDTAAREELSRIATSGGPEQAAARKELGSRNLDARYTKTGRERAGAAA